MNPSLKDTNPLYYDLTINFFEELQINNHLLKGYFPIQIMCINLQTF